MKENVGSADRAARSILGPTLMLLGYLRWGGSSGRLKGLGAMLAGALVVESAVTRVCPVNAWLGIDTRTNEEKRQDLAELLDERRVTWTGGETAAPPSVH